ncbi:hypothetical protein [Bifidobacterium reuteri]|uniref:hypothetical protein n=1 Tax=Bifidobacterium reuteri TaxID=983706 RepID=UPI001CC30430|nr:hypothetical protein [Bifidobacterium reuteri]
MPNGTEVKITETKVTEAEVSAEQSAEVKQQDTKQPEAKKGLSKGAIVIAIIVAVALIAATGVFGYRAYADAQFNNAMAACATASEDVRNATNDYNNLLNGDASDASALTKDDVKDPSTLDALNKAMGAEVPVYEGCIAEDTKGYQAATDKLTEQVDWYKTHTTALQKAVDAVNASKK